MIPLIAFRNVSSFPQEDFGLNRINFSITARGRTHLITKTDDKLHTLLKLLEGGISSDQGFIEKEATVMIQSDRQLLGDKVLAHNAGYYLALENDAFFYFEGKNRSKENFVNKLKARHIRHYRIYKLRGEEKRNFTMLAMLFQESGTILINSFIINSLSEILQEIFFRFINGSPASLCFCSSLETPPLFSLDEVLQDREIERFEL